ncbi:lipopolysaccharide transport periplasmic protein LptA [Sulfurimonas sp. HSL1-2]|uniref:lipopolysaccharide transport periplasmic protein LptA n=1 Tax=Thiomicrolovo zhangzhouensis TaxID=3131933 RepID=UPI0031F8BFDA
MKSALALIAIIAAAGSLCAAEQLKIAADAFTANEKQGRSVFEGHVRIKMGSDELNASRVEVYTAEDRTPTKYIASGDASFFLKADNGATYSGRAQKVIYLPLKEQYSFYGDVHLMQHDEHKQIDGEEVVVNIQEGTAAARGAERQPVIMIFNLPEEKKK